MIRLALNSPREVLITFGGALAWLAHFLLIYLLAEFGCIANLDNLSWWILGITAATFFPALLAVYLCRFPHMRTSLYLNATFSFIILFETIPVFYFKGACQWFSWL